MTDESPKHLRTKEHGKEFIGSREGVSSTTSAEMPANSRPKKK